MVSRRPRQTVDHSALRCRLRDPETGDYLRFDAVSVTEVCAWSWSGTRKQADTLRARAEARGEPWPFVIVDLEGL